MVALKQEQQEMVEKRWVSHQEKDDLHTKFKEEREHIQQEKEKLLT
jgi:hypothetical protein